MDLKMAALVAIAVVIPLAMLWVAYSGEVLLQAKPASSENGIQNNAQSTGPHTTRVVASFFPLYDFARHVGGNKINVVTMVPVGVEPHDWEPTAQQILNLRGADLFVYNGAGIDSWGDKVETKLKVNASEGLQLITDSHGKHDPHTWLDPVLAKSQVELIRNGLIKADPQNTDYYIQNAQSYIARLDSLDAKTRSELSDCAKTDFIAFHSAFSYFSIRYGLHQHTILGEDPEGEILPQTLNDLIQFAKQYGIHVIYSEDLLDPRNAQVIASEIPNGKVLVLTPIEGVDKEEQKAGIGYVEKMETNLENLKQGLECK
jgi:zinc transport system substrate-binding protein